MDGRSRGVPAFATIEIVSALVPQGKEADERLDHIPNDRRVLRQRDCRVHHPRGPSPFAESLITSESGVDHLLPPRMRQSREDITARVSETKVSIRQRINDLPSVEHADFSCVPLNQSHLPVLCAEGDSGGPIYSTTYTVLGEALALGTEFAGLTSYRIGTTTPKKFSRCVYAKIDVLWTWNLSLVTNVP